MRLLVAALAAQLFAQTPAPPGRSLPPPPTVKLNALTEAERKALNSSERSALVAGVHRRLPAKAAKGRWTTLKDGTRLWRVAIHSPCANALRIHFRGLDAGKGKVWVYSSDGSQPFGPYSGKGPGEQGDFWSDVVDSDTVIIEYQADGKLIRPPFTVPEISHLAR